MHKEEYLNKTIELTKSMKSTSFITRRCGKCKKDIGDSWQGSDCPVCNCSLEKWGVKVDFIIRCPECNTVITDRERDCSECGFQLDGETLELDQ